MVHASELMRYENELMAQGCRYVCGVDEVGRGPLAGPVTCAAVIGPGQSTSGWRKKSDAAPSLIPSCPTTTAA